MKKSGFKSSGTTFKQGGDFIGITAGQGNGGFSKGAGKAQAVSVTYSQDVMDELRFMIEEEKLAGDLYEAFGDLYGLKVFDRIARSEDKHFNALVKQANKMGVNVDEILAEETGSYVNDDLQNMYDTFLAQGSKSVTAALKVGVAIEERDIQDLNDAMDLAAGTNLERVYDKLLKGSENHLDAFEKAISGAGGSSKSEGKSQAVSVTYSQDVVDELRIMIEEEKLAGDVYEAFGDLYGRKIFDRIARSEDKHFNALVKQADKMDVDIDQILFAKKGEYVDDDLQNMYDTLLLQGSQSETAALKVGVTIEEKDILDLSDAAELAAGLSLERVYNKLLNGSENHLDAFQDALMI